MRQRVKFTLMLSSERRRDSYDTYNVSLVWQGCSERLDPFTGTRPPWSAKRNEDYGYARMTVINGTHLYLEQVSDDKVRAPFY